MKGKTLSSCNFDLIQQSIKAKLRVHSGISREHRKKLINEYLTRHY